MVPLLLLALVGLFFVLRPDPPSDASADEPRERTFDLAIQEGVLVPGEITVDEGDQVILLLTSDNPVEFHLHGYDLEEEVGPGEPAELSFDATITGRFEIENHHTEAVLGEIIVRPR